MTPLITRTGRTASRILAKTIGIIARLSWRGVAVTIAIIILLIVRNQPT